ncbi:hypothetical protein [Aquimarina latercula]|uniref:hypothetical protein n=1 Tax=Aquimarina latercula TaxID=987 RepID=UPI00041B2BCE|nr:hypothetical protein [Aquimarina latercula]
MKKGMLVLAVLLIIFFISKDLLFIVKPYKKHSISSLLKDKIIKDSLSYEFTTVTINSVSEIYGFKSQPNNVVFGVKYFNADKSCWVKTLVDTPYLLFIGTNKKEGEVIEVLYDKSAGCNTNKNAIYVPNQKDTREVKYIKLIKIGVLSLFIIFLIRDIFFKAKNRTEK